MAFRLRHRRALSATACAVLAILATSATGATSASADTAPVMLSLAQLGLNTAPWDYVYAANTSAGGGVDIIQPLLKAASVDMLRYGGGSTSDTADVLAYESVLPGGRHAVAFINTNTSSAETVTFRPCAALFGTLRTWSYSAGNQNATNSSIITGTTSARSVSDGITLPAESMTILETR